MPRGSATKEAVMTAVEAAPKYRTLYSHAIAPVFIIVKRQEYGAMQIICISKGTESGGQELAEKLAEKLGYACLGREDLVTEATKAGIQVGKLEMTMVKSGIFNERLAAERDHYLAFSTAYLCRKAMEEGGLVYHGRTGHHLLVGAGISHILKLRVLDEKERQVKAVSLKLNLERNKAKQYIEEVEEDVRRWVHSMYGIAWEDLADFDLAINLSQITPNNAAAMLVEFAQLPEFKMTPRSRAAMENLLLASNARIRLSRDEHTFRSSFKVQADDGIVTVSYLPGDADVAKYIPDICRNLPGLKEIRTTMAMTNILWIQETFDPDSDVFDNIATLATKWNAAVELIGFKTETENMPSPMGNSSEGERTATSPAPNTYNGGIEDDTGGVEDPISDIRSEDDGFQKTRNKLAELGRSGGGYIAYGDERQLVDNLDKSLPYVLVVIGKVFSGKAHAAQLRAIREFKGFMSERIKAPVVTVDELETQYLFTSRDVFRTAIFLAVTVSIYLLVFNNQERVLAFLGQSGWYAEMVKNSFLSSIGWLPKILVSLVVFLFVPIVAYLYGSAAKALLKLIKIE
ncbi:MAG: cytidylate kinase-like family protein [Proteobacteria bacterium]|nr:cytidylate kinase-like family protein [Pseudomonadota bacterium]